MNISIASLEQKVNAFATQLQSKGYQITEIDTVRLGSYGPSYVTLMIEDATGIPFFFKILANGYHATGSEIATVDGWKSAKNEIISRLNAA